MRKQTDINAKMRSILFDWLVEVHLKFKLVPETLFMTCGLIDRYLEKEQVMRDRLQLVGIAAMFIASKYEEIFAPEYRSLVESPAPLGLAVMSTRRLGLGLRSSATREPCVSPGNGWRPSAYFLQVQRLVLHHGPRVQQGGAPAHGGLHPRHPRLPANHQVGQVSAAADWLARLWLAGTACGTLLWRPTAAQCRVPPTARRPFCAQADDAQRARLPEALRQGGVPRSQPRRAALAARAARAAC